MGLFSKKEASPSATVRVELDRAEWRAGEELTGRVVVAATAPVDNAVAGLRIWGYEQMKWEGVGQGAPIRGPVKTTPERTWSVLAHDIKLDGPGRAWEAGVYTYPFSLVLPEYLPNSFHYNFDRIMQMKNVSIDMIYGVTAKLRSTSFEAEYEVLFTVQPPAKAEQTVDTQPISVVQASDVRGPKIFKRGSCTITMNIPTNVFTPASMIEAEVTVSLANARPLDHVTLALYQVVSIDKEKRYLPLLPKIDRLACCRRYGDVGETGTQQARTLRLPITPHNFDPSEPLAACTETRFLTIEYAVRVECGFVGKESDVVSVEAPVTLVAQ